MKFIGVDRSPMVRFVRSRVLGTFQSDSDSETDFRIGGTEEREKQEGEEERSEEDPRKRILE